MPRRAAQSTRSSALIATLANGPPQTRRRKTEWEGTLRSGGCSARRTTLMWPLIIWLGAGSRSSPIIGGHRWCPYYSDENHALIGRFPALIIPILGSDGSLQSAQRIYDADVTPRKKILPPVN